MANKSWGVEYHKEAQRLAAEGLTWREIGAEIGVPWQTVASWPDVKTALPTVIPMPAVREVGQGWTDEDIVGLAEQAVDNGRSTAQLAEMYGVSKYIIRKFRNDPVYLQYVRSKAREISDLIFGGIEKKVVQVMEAPVNNFQQGSVGLEKLSKFLVDMQILQGEEMQGIGKKTVMDLVALVEVSVADKRPSLMELEARLGDPPATGGAPGAP